jgi:hypothetical protein
MRFMTALSELLAARMAERGVGSSRELARLTRKPARERGLQPLSGVSVASYVGGSHGKVGERAMRLLADALALPIEQVRTAAGAPPGEPEPYEPPPEAAQLSRTQRLAVDQIIRLLAGTEPAAEGSRMLGPAPEEAEVEWTEHADADDPPANSEEPQATSGNPPERNCRNM